MTIRRLIRYLRPHRLVLGAAFALLLLGTAADLAGPYLVSRFIDDYLTPRTFPKEAILGFAGIYLTLHLASVAFQYGQLLLFQRIALRVIHRMRTEVFGKVQHLGLSFFDRTPAGTLVSRITNDTEAVKDLYVSVLSTFVQNGVFLLGIFVAMFVLDWRLASLCLVLLPVLYLLMRTFRTYSSRVYRVTREKLGELNGLLSESLQGMNIIQALRQEGRMIRRVERLNEEIRGAFLRSVRLNGLLLRPAVDLLRILTLMGVVSFFAGASASGAVKVGVLYAFLQYLDRFFEPVNTMMQRLAQLQQALVAGERVFQLLDTDEWAPGEKPGALPAAEAAAGGEVRTASGAGLDRPGAETVRAEAAFPGVLPPASAAGLIEFDRVTFSYDGRVDVLRDISFTVRPGETVALVGHTGSGKSSIIQLLLHFYNVRSGEIRIDGVPLSRIGNDELRARIGLVQQDPFLFAGTVRSNIALHDGAVTEEAVREAVSLVQLEPFIRRLPRGLDEPVVERGAAFSSGERQLLSFARTIARRPGVLLLDEATANIDTETEEAIQAALTRMRAGRTTIAIAHRLSTIQDANQILVLHRGEIVERGTHQELLRQGGLYRAMYLLQQGGVAAKV
ncbi:multidrug ABC transporter ATP-binding protein [Paenibacillus sp. J31TS4]|uniref:ABC transporter ATP-binding protein n=1 Tax=Paenibacillus sp. J31TS4 TaxID=2807195 RepID=UPI001B0F8D39|nr:ABC transporter transmembrane domain-containing protein [Paenibacillus sp. J31TS4]GIP40324.1 multidrug ABC transporter ATP-binding protein [Paenibacillus sp. J31TS4]